ncbi:MAG: flagellar L-ring protein precursor FlgH [Halioglobus sp.]|jgi:flagellar L-ring protein precursor FlgH
MRIQRKFKLCLALMLGVIFTQTASSENLYTEAGFQSYVADKKAYRVGDTLMLLIFENSQAKSASDKSVDREYGLSGGVATEGSAGGRGSLDIALDREASESTGRVGNLKATVTVSVTSIDSLGNLQVEGKQRIVLNGEEQLITVSGLIRPIDVEADNTVYSTRLGNALIEYNGYEGEERNWLYRTLSKIGLI